MEQDWTTPTIGSSTSPSRCSARLTVFSFRSLVTALYCIKFAAMELRFVQLAFLLAFCSWEVTLGFQHSPSAASVRSFGTAPLISSFPRSVRSRIPMVVGDQPLDWTPDQGFQGSRVRRYFARPSDGLTFKQRLTKMGLAAALSYGWVSNMSYSVTVSLAWYISCKRVRTG